MNISSLHRYRQKLPRHSFSPHGILSLCSLSLLTISLASAINVIALTTSYAQITVNVPTQVSIVNGNPGLTPDNDSFEGVAPPNADLFIFESAASNLVENDTNNGRDIFQYRKSDKKVTRLSVTSKGEQSAIAEDDSIPQSTEPSVSNVLPDGTYGVAFISNATNLAAEGGYDNSGLNNQVYLRLPTLSKTVLISRGPDGKTAGNGDCQNPHVVALSGPNRFTVAFASKASNLKDPVGESENANYIIYIAEVTIAPNGSVSVKVEDTSRLNTQVLTGDFYHPVLSGDARYLTFVSDATDVIPGLEISGTQVYRFDRLTKTPLLISKNSAGEHGIEPSFAPSISFKGDLISFATEATNLGIDASASMPKYALWNAATGALSLINKDVNGTPSNGINFSENYYPSCSISSDGKYATFIDLGDNLVEGDTNQLADVFVKDLVNGTVLRVSTDANRGQLSTNSAFPNIGAASFNSSGAYILFQSRDPNLGTATDGDHPDGDNYNRIFFSTVSLPPPPLEKNTVIDIPPDVKVSKKDITLTLKLFSLASTSAATLGKEPIDSASNAHSLDQPLYAALSSFEPRTAAAKKLQWELQIIKTGGKFRINKIIDRNKITIKKLTPGTYKVKYRCLAKLSSKKVIASKYSPEAKFVIR